jgi:hypothetical protein
MVEQAHEIQFMVKKLELLKIIVPGNFLWLEVLSPKYSIMEGFHHYSQTQEDSHVYLILNCISWC